MDLDWVVRNIWPLRDLDEGGVASGGGGVELFRLLGPDSSQTTSSTVKQQGNNLEGSAPGAHPVQRTGVTPGGGGG